MILNKRGKIGYILIQNRKNALIESQKNMYQSPIRIKSMKTNDLGLLYPSG